jgi:precorrin-8X/cobalt-precorrin-8 methylmutase
MAQPPRDYLRDPAAIYERSFALIRHEAALDRVPDDLEPLVARLIHACGMIDLVDDLAWSESAAEAGRTALRSGAPVLVDCAMVEAGIAQARLPAGNAVICTLHDTRTAGLAAAQGNTRSAAAVEIWGDRLNGAVVAIGNAPTALFRLLELLDAGAPAPALVLGFPVGFVGAAEAKQALIERNPVVPHVVLRGRRGGSALAAAAVNALALGAP